MTQRANPKTGCLTAVVRRLLCSGSQQTHPSDNILDSDETLQLLISYEENEEPKKEIKTETETQNDDVSLHPPPPPPPPNVVAKLMGLDHPAPGSKRFRYFDDSGSAVTRSKSVNFMDYILKGHEEEEENEDEKDGQRQCRRVKASVSFREIVPTSARWSSNNQQKKHDFLLLYLDKLDEKRELVGSSSFSRSKRFEKVVEDSKKPPLPPSAPKKKENEKVAKKFKDEPRKVAKKKKSENRNDVNGAKKVRWFLSPSKSKSSSEKTALLGESKNIRADEFIGKESESPENKSNASPVSVLDRDLYDYLILDDDYYFSGGDSESASELSTKQVETATKSSCSSSPAKTKTSTKKENNNSTNNDSEETEFITKLMNMLSDLSEEDMKSSTWVSTSSTKPVDFTQVEDFCVEFGQEILDLVMDQLVDELCI
ncbi:hypothetical protein [Arabidopsis thaliana]|jgi:hypothetical protein|uniref:ALC-interacting protein 1 n=1 Tax=Arabidopsis thaliana TaxID=3702 RepID=Q9M035_ARATH|nr:ALC-interacting protein 1 [Arabidopsis thaliana]ABN04766.1 At5g01370 [Arabidopsis thaliana]AED90333.1 ALC-interacting protein 1 [Arabidopsis thaliana]CAB81920.1 hypothetical protein [Arabidopsis thaliana]|eukprot:NP_195757.1 ALC-interacting protein 1 [Arabidopsis thaliana]